LDKKSKKTIVKIYERTMECEIIIITIGLFLLASYFLYYYYIDTHEKDEIELHIESTNVVDEQPEEIVVSTETVDTQEENFWVDYKVILEIPKINLKKD